MIHKLRPKYKVKVKPAPRGITTNKQILCDDFNGVLYPNSYIHSANLKNNYYHNYERTGVNIS